MRVCERKPATSSRTCRAGLIRTTPTWARSSTPRMRRTSWVTSPGRRSAPAARPAVSWRCGQATGHGSTRRGSSPAPGRSTGRDTGAARARPPRPVGGGGLAGQRAPGPRWPQPMFRAARRRRAAPRRCPGRRGRSEHVAQPHPAPRFSVALTRQSGRVPRRPRAPAWARAGSRRRTGPRRPPAA